MNGADLKGRRERLRLTQLAVAERLKVSPATVRNWEAEPTAVPMAVEVAWPVWERRFQQESPHFGAVTLFYTGAPMWVALQGPRRPLGVPGQEPFLDNASALARVGVLWGRNGFASPLILTESGDILWTSNELEKVMNGSDTTAPTVPVMLRSIAAYVRTYAERYVRSGPRLHSPAEVKAHRGKIEAEASNLDGLAKADSRTATDVSPYEAIHDRLNGLGMYALGDMANGVYHAYAARAMPWPVG